MKQEPRIGNILGLSFKVKRDHNQLVDDALDMFSKAEAKMESAIEQINSDIDSDRKEIADIENRIYASEQSMGKLTRVLGRLKALVE